MYRRSVFIRLAAALVAAVASSCGHAPPAHTTPLSTPAPLSPLAALAASCRSGEQDACDALAEQWSGREILLDPLADDARAAAAALDRACEHARNAAACVGLALMHKYGTTGAGRDDAAAARLFARVRERGALRGCRGEPPSEQGAAALAAAAHSCDEGRARACAVLAWAAFTGVQRERDPSAAFVSWERACELESGTGCRWAGHVAFTYAEVGAPERASSLLERACELGPPGGCAELGLFLETVRHDDAAALARYEAACADGSRDGCALAANVLARTPETVDRANAFRRRACDAGHTEACTALESEP